MGLQSTLVFTAVPIVEKRLPDAKIPEDVTFVRFCHGCDRLKGMQVPVNQRTWTEGRRVQSPIDGSWHGVCTPCWNNRRIRKWIHSTT